MPPGSPASDNGVSVHELDTRTSVLETRYEYLQKTLDDAKLQITDINSKVDKVAEHVVQQRITIEGIPRMEANLDRALSKLGEQEKREATSSVKQKLLWGIGSAILTGAVMLIIKALMGGG